MRSIVRSTDDSPAWKFYAMWKKLNLEENFENLQLYVNRLSAEVTSQQKPINATVHFIFVTCRNQYYLVHLYQLHENASCTLVLREMSAKNNKFFVS